MRKFRQFMQREGCWDQFKNNFKQFSNYSTLEELATNQQPCDYLLAAFSWASSGRKNYDYWNNRA